ncbi:unnamed protein product [Mytilus edulis]|uniref:Uncharacterized protein n=1 Tax=Mytilus edulis TaxID=6550 RepID=A0A8S3UWL9_MYTED|nr:unnamed protein product [Mytilus edulis]
MILNTVIVLETKYSRNYTSQTFSTELQNHAENIEDDNTSSLHRNVQSMTNDRKSSFTTETAEIKRSKRQTNQLFSTTPWKPTDTSSYKMILKSDGFSIKPGVDETSDLHKLDNHNSTTSPSTMETIAEDLHDYNYENATSFLPEIHNDLPEIHNDLPEIHNDLPEIHNDLPEIHNDLPEIHYDHYDEYDYDYEMAYCPRLNCSSWQCSCEEHCLIFNDCCYVMLDKLFGTLNYDILAERMKNKTTALQSLGYDTHQIKLAEMIAQYGECTLVELRYHFYTVIVTCPDDFLNYFIENRCRNTRFGDIWDIPVYIKFSEKYQITFRNIFCALCHGFTIKDIQFWNATLHCPDVRTPELDGCFVLKNVNQHELLPNTCISPYPEKLETCDHLTSNGESILCSSFVAPVILGLYRFRNEYCLGCLNYNVPQSDPNPKCELDKVGFSDHRPDYQGVDIFFHTIDMDWFQAKT